MSTLTKEWLQQTIAELEEERDAVPGAVNEDAAMALAAMKLALASLEAEPDYMRYDCGCCGWETIEDWRENDVCPKCNHHPMGKTPLYTAPPAPVSLTDEQRAMLREMDDEIVAELDEEERACRAAMLQGAEQTNYRAIVERIAEIIHGKVTDIDLLTVTVKSMKDKLQK